jgi:thiamine-phosphate pyrophosphorylase
MKPEIDYSLYLVTDRTLMSTPTLEEAVENALKGGCTLVQLREKTASSRELFTTAQNLRTLTHSYNIPLIINDRVDIALAAQADGVHIGQQDLPASTVRSLLGPDKILGVSVHTVEEAIAARDAQADYVSVGAMFPTSTKSEATPVPAAELERIRCHIALPLVVIGGITPQSIPRLLEYGVDGIVIVSAIIAQPDIEHAARTIKRIIRQRKGGSL